MLFFQGLDLSCSETEQKAHGETEGKISSNKYQIITWRWRQRIKTLAGIPTLQCSSFAEYLLPLSMLPFFDQHLILLFSTQYVGKCMLQTYCLRLYSHLEVTEIKHIKNKVLQRVSKGCQCHFSAGWDFCEVLVTRLIPQNTLHNRMKSLAFHV